MEVTLEREEILLQVTEAIQAMAETLEREEILLQETAETQGREEILPRVTEVIQEMEATQAKEEILPRAMVVTQEMAAEVIRGHVTAAMSRSANWLLALRMFFISAQPLASAATTVDVSCEGKALEDEGGCGDSC